MQKQNFRVSSLKRLKNLQKQKRYIIDKKINNRLYQLIREYRAHTVMAYIPLSLEVNIMPLIRQLRANRITVLVPFMEGTSFRLVKYRMPLIKKQFGIREPKISNQFRKSK